MCSCCSKGLQFRYRQYLCPFTERNCKTPLLRNTGKPYHAHRILVSHHQSQTVSCIAQQSHSNPPDLSTECKTMLMSVCIHGCLTRLIFVCISYPCSLSYNSIGLAGLKAIAKLVEQSEILEHLKYEWKILSFSYFKIL